MITTRGPGVDTFGTSPSFANVGARQQDKCESQSTAFRIILITYPFSGGLQVADRPPSRMAGFGDARRLAPYSERKVSARGAWARPPVIWGCLLLFYILPNENLVNVAGIEMEHHYGHGPVANGNANGSFAAVRAIIALQFIHNRRQIRWDPISVRRKGIGDCKNDNPLEQCAGGIADGKFRSGKNSQLFTIPAGVKL